MYEKEEVVYYIFVEAVVARFIDESKWIDKHTRRLEIWRIRYSIRYISGQGRAASRKTVAPGAHRWRTKCSRCTYTVQQQCRFTLISNFKAVLLCQKTKQKSSPARASITRKLKRYGSGSEGGGGKRASACVCVGSCVNFWSRTLSSL